MGNRYQDKVISLIGAFGINSINAYTKNSFSGSILDTLELKLPLLQNVITSNGAIYNISEERLEQLDGDILFFLVFGNYSTESFEKLRQRPLWKTLKAAQKGQVYLVDGDTWGGSSLLAADAIIDDLYKYLVNTP